MDNRVELELKLELLLKHIICFSQSVFLSSSLCD